MHCLTFFVLVLLQTLRLKVNVRYQNYHTLTSFMARTMKDWNKLSASEMAARDADTFKIAERIYEMYFSKVYHTFYSLTMLITFLL